jgi:hypothetical protein
VSASVSVTTQPVKMLQALPAPSMMGELAGLNPQKVGGKTEGWPRQAAAEGGGCLGIWE